MSQVLLLDSGPLGLIANPQSSGEAIAARAWLSALLLAGVEVLVPAIVYYELKRELLRAGKAVGVGRLEAFVAASPGRYLPLSDAALRLAAQALSLRMDVVIATTNRKHLSQFVPAMHWSEILSRSGLGKKIRWVMKGLYF